MAILKNTRNIPLSFTKASMKYNMPLKPNSLEIYWILTDLEAGKYSVLDPCRIPIFYKQRKQNTVTIKNNKGEKCLCEGKRLLERY